MISKDRLLINQQIYNFLRTVTIKFAPIADYLNASLETAGFTINYADKSTWKYYMNMHGMYHESDTPMYVTSLDTQASILFTGSVLREHPRTLQVYKPGGLYYDRLCKLYPSQVDLIKSILFPVEDLDSAIQAEDFTLLQYGSGYLEEYEEKPMIMELIAFLKIYVERWYFDFLDDEPLFYLTAWGTLWSQLGMLLMAIRESYIRTPYAHSFHIWNELQSKGLDDYSDILDREKTMLLYQNINYFRNNSGKHSNLLILANRLLSSYGISIYGRRVLQESETGEAEYQLTPQFEAVRIPTDNYTLTSEIASINAATIQSSVYEKGLTLSNTAESNAAASRRLGETTLNRFMTKFLEIRPIPKNKVYADQLNTFLVETLVTSIVNDYYTQPVTVLDSAMDITLYLRPRELLAIYHYAIQKSIGITPEFIPNKFRFYKSFDIEIKTPSKVIYRGDEKIYITQHFDSALVLAGLDYNTAVTTPDEFTAMASRLWLRYMEHMLDDQETSIERRGYILSYLMTMCHTRREETHQLVDGFTDYISWLGSGGIDIANSIFKQYDSQPDPRKAWANLADSITSSLIPIDDTLAFFGNFTLSDYGYDRLRQLFIQMCSYQVVFLESSRDLAEFAFGAKTSHYYGPTDKDTFTDLPFVMAVATVKVHNHDKVMDILPCTVHHDVHDIHRVSTYNVTPGMPDLSHEVMHRNEVIVPPVYKVATSHHTGMIHMGKTMFTPLVV